MNTVHSQLLSVVPLSDPGVIMRYLTGLGALQYFQSPEMTESSIKKGQYITVERFFFPFFIQKLKRSKYITLFTYCASCLEITEKEHTDKHSNQRNTPSITLSNLIVSIVRIGIQVSFNINITSK